MKKSKRQTNNPAAAAPRAAESGNNFLWWPWAAAAAALFLVFELYGGAIDGPFVLDDRYLPFFAPGLQDQPVLVWLNSARPLLMLSFFLDHWRGGVETHAYHVTNILLHFLVSVVLTLVVGRLLEVGPPEFRAMDKKLRTALAVVAGAIFLVHPLQTESVAYVASRSETLSVLFFFSAYLVFLYKNPSHSISVGRMIAIVALFGAALSSKEHTLTLPVLILLTDLFWIREGWRKNQLLYGTLAAGALLGAVGVARVLAHADTAGFSVQGLKPVTYFATQCRVLWDYLRLFVVPVGQNADPDIPVSGLADPWALLGLAGLVALAAAAWVYRQRWPLAALGLAIFLLLIAPTSSIIPIRDVLAERRMYLPMLGLILVLIEFLRRVPMSRVVGVGAAVVIVLSVLTYQRARLWGTPLELWADAAAKSPKKVRPRFQLAYARYEAGDCPAAVADYEAAAKLAPPDYTLLSDWALALDCTGHAQEAIEKLTQAAKMERNPYAYAVMGMVYGKQGKREEALAALNHAERIDPKFAMTYVYRGNVAEVSGDIPAAVAQYQKALELEPTNPAALTGLGRVNGARR